MKRTFLGAPRCALLLAWALMWAAPAAAKAPPISVAAHAGYRSAHELRVVGEGQWALNDSVALTVRAGPGFWAGPVRGTVLAGAMARLDALTWVPGVFVLGGITVPDVRPTLQVGAELLRYVSLHSAWAGSVAAEWAGGDDFAAVVLLGARYQL